MTRRLLVLVLSLLAFAPVAEAAFVPAESLGRKPARCGVGCRGGLDILAVSWLADLTIKPEVSRPGQRVMVTVTPLNSALKGWHWPWRGCAPDTLVCRFKAGAPTKRWVRTVVGWSNPIGRAWTEVAWAVIGKHDELLHGHVRDQAGDGVGGIKVYMARKGARGGVYSVTGLDGYYNAIVEPGTYFVYPGSRPKKSDRFTPESKKVVVKKDSKATANFTLERSMKVTLQATPGAVEASGEATVELLISVRRDGGPLPGTKVDVWPTASSPAESLKVPAVICAAGARFWPTADPGVPGASIPKAVTTDANGEARLTLRTGMVPGTVTIQAWAEDDRGALRTKNVDDVRDEASVAVNARPGGTVGSLTLLRQTLQAYVAAQQIELTAASAAALADQLNALAPAAGMADVIFSPMRKVVDGEEAVMASLATTQPLLGRDGAFSTSAPTYVIPFRRLNGPLLALYGGFAGVVQGGALPELPLLGQWQAGTPTTGYTFVAGTAERLAPSLFASMGWLGKTVPRLCRG